MHPMFTKIFGDNQGAVSTHTPPQPLHERVRFLIELFGVKPTPKHSALLGGSKKVFLSEIRKW